MKKASSELLLLDANVLLALAWPNHQFHHSATARMESGGKWATCALTELAFIRLSSNPAVVGVAKSPLECAMLLAALIADSRHVFIDPLPSPASKPFIGNMNSIMGYRQVTDAYLLALARCHRAIFLTFDSRLAALSQAAGEIEVLERA